MFIQGQNSTRRALIIVGENKHLDFTEALRDSLQSGRVQAKDLEDVDKSKGDCHFDEALEQFLSSCSGIIVICSEELRSCIDQQRIVTVTINDFDISLNGAVLSSFLKSEVNVKKCIPLSSDTAHLPAALKEKHFIKLPHGTIDDDHVEKAVNEINTMLESFQAK